MARGRRAWAWLLVLLVAAPGPAQDTAPEVDAAIEVAAREATVGDRLETRLVVTHPAGTRLEPPQIGPTLGPFAVVDGIWSGPVEVDGGRRWTWSGAIVSFRPGQLELPAVRIVVENEAGEQHSVTTDPIAIDIQSVLDPEEADADAAGLEIADLKPPAGLPPDYGPLVVAAGVLGALLLGAGILWWLHRRYAARLAAVPAPDDPFHRTPPHEWVYAELQKLLEQRLAEQGQVELFFAELARIVKRYLGGRFRVELMERTTTEVPQALGQAGAEREVIRDVGLLLARCDLVKFARRSAGAEECRSAIEQAYRIVDATKPRTEQGAA